MANNHFYTRKRVPAKTVLMAADAISAALLLLLLYAAISKLADHAGFISLLGRSPLLHPFAGIFAWLLPGTELAIAVLLFFTHTRLTGLYATLLLLSSFTVYLVYVLLFSSDVPCSCGGVLKQLSWPQHIVFNMFFILLSVIGIVLYRKHREAIPPTPP
ncbi:MauE/DoxX family redox-associated membrane protein [Ferruginibacter sp.]|uniref:MauE/DoxX family redox-associated membrane protein n=1 Tax=Ferruginibacter sp. TaxID=1940288 RepID=UPI002658519A|nr:MauE/DoxX family redox-associated membrane protein [Ferruginibacter sp.]